jgi:hypothetical protein
MQLRIAALEQQDAAKEQQIAALEQHIAAQQKEIADQQQLIAAVQHANSQLRQQLKVTHATGLHHADQLLAQEQQIQELMAVRQQTAKTQDDISKLHSRQEQLQRQQQRGECQVSVVFKDTTPLPEQGTASHLQQLLRKKLGITITVQRVQQLGSKPRNSNAAATRRSHAYKVTLGSGGERTAVLRAKAQRLRGTSMTIDALLTPQQLAAKQQLLPVARQAKAAGQTVHWRYDTLFVDGKQYTGPGSLPTPAEQQAAAAQQQQEGWQTVQHKKQQQKVAARAATKPKPTAATEIAVGQQLKATAKAAKVAKAAGDKAVAQQQPAQQQHAKQPLQVSQQPNTYAEAAASAPGSKANRQHAAPAAKGGAGGAPGALGGVGESRAQSELSGPPTAHRGTGPPSPEAPSKAAGSSEQLAKGGSEVAVTVAAASDSPRPSPPSSPTRA